MIAAQSFPDLTGKSENEAWGILLDAGFRFKSTTLGGYSKFIHDDGSHVWVRPNGEVIRLGPKVKSKAGKMYHPRFDQRGDKTPNHSTGEFLVR